MSANPLDKLERQLETRIEGAFSRLFRGSINARDIAVLLLRSMEDKATTTDGSGSIPLAPDRYTITLHPQNARHLLEHADLTARLAAAISEICAESGYQLGATPEVLILQDRQLDLHQARVTAEHNEARTAKTKKMRAVTDADDAWPGAEDGSAQVMPPG